MIPQFVLSHRRRQRRFLQCLSHRRKGGGHFYLRCDGTRGAFGPDYQHDSRVSRRAWAGRRRRRRVTHAGQSRSCRHSQTSETTMFATCFYVVADVERAQLRFANAGHPSALHI